MIFEDVCEMGNVQCKDVLSGTYKTVPSTHFTFAGFECDSVSSLNPNAKDNRGCVAAAVDKTGTTSAGVLSYVEIHKPHFLGLENVKGLKAKGPDGKSNLDHLIEKLNALGYLVYSSLMHSNQYYVPQRRARMLILCSLSGRLH